MSEGQVTLAVESKAAFKAQALALARALDQGALDGQVSHISFPDMATLLSVVSPKRLELLQTLRRSGPTSVRALSMAVARDYKSVHGDVATLIAHGLIERQTAKQIAVLWDHVRADLALAA